MPIAKRQDLYVPYATWFNRGGSSGGSGGGPEDVIATLDPVAWYKFTDGAGTSLTDFSGNAEHGTLGATTAAPTWVASPASLSFDGGDRVALPVLPEVQGWDIVFKSDAAVSAATSPAQAILCFSDANDDENGLLFGNFTGGLTDEVVSVAQNTSAGFATTRRRAWLDAVASIPQDEWHLLQCDLRDGDPHFTIRVDGTDQSNSGNNLVAFHTDNWFIGSNGAGSFGFTGDIAYVVFYGTLRTDQQQADCRTALAATMAARGITLP